MLNKIPIVFLLNGCYISLFFNGRFSKEKNKSQQSELLVCVFDRQRKEAC